MTPEHQLVPYQTVDLPPGPWLVFAPHPDDETYGMGGSLLRAAEAGIDTHVAVMTDGALGGAEGSDTQALVAARRREVAEATARLGVRSLEMFNEPDRGLAVTDAVIDQARRSIGDTQPGTVFFPAPLELHPDHRAAAQIVWQALQRLNAELLPAPWAYEIGVQNPINRLLDITGVVDGKLEAMRIYASQNAVNSYPDVMLALNCARTYTLPSTVSHAEGFFRYRAEDLHGELREATERHLARYW